jgi:hypothetical protein
LIKFQLNNLEEKNVQEALHKEQIAELEAENRRLKVVEQTLHDLQLKYLEVQIQLNHQKAVSFSWNLLR